ncbi:hypothetical protein GCM10009687_47890 [Asanoa iriomotensis]|uniref:Uncharacterized protein n=1 Tax=Asanoa iriomotensis TaxID=234613 RepID=A0ABQ4C0X3_9ACTN|nr:hypothetical protein Air01nite_21760 [Asanoa iriomotensis]
MAGDPGKPVPAPGILIACPQCGWRRPSDRLPDACDVDPNHRVRALAVFVACVECGWENWFASMPGCSKSTADNKHDVRVLEVAYR